MIQRLLKLSATCCVSYSQVSVITGEWLVRLYLPMKISIFNSKNTKVKVQIIIKWYIVISLQKSVYYPLQS
jgi:hypothetical protein